MDEPAGLLLDEASPDHPVGGARPRPVPFGAADLYRALLESMTEGVSLSDEAGVIVYTNPAEDALFGYAPGELVGRHVSVQNAYPAEENQQRVREVIGHLRIHGQWQGEWLNRRKDGSTFVTASRITAVNLDGRTHWLCVQRDITAERMADAERSRAEERLRENEERLRLAASAAKIGTWDFDLVSGRGRWDEEARRIGGLPDDDDLTYDADTWLRLVHPDDRDRVGAMFAASLAPHGSAYDVEFRCAAPAADGGPRWVTSHGAVLRAPETGVATRAVGIVRDATARRRNLERLAEGEAKLRTLTNALPAFVWLARPDGELHYFNDRWYEYTGQTFSEALPNGWADTLHPDDRDRTARAWAEARAGGLVYEIEVRYRRHDGGYRWYVARAEPSRGPDGAVTGWVGTSIDIHDRRTAEAALRESEQRLQLAKQAAGIAVWDWDLRTNAIAWSPEMYDLLDIDPATPAGALFEAWAGAMHPDDRDAAVAIARAAATTGEPIAMDFRIVRRDGETRWIRSQGIAARGEDDRPVRLTGVNLDVSAQHRLEDELRGRADQLAAAVAERTRERNRVFELSNDLFAAAGFDGYLKTVNPAWEKLLGYGEAELLTRPFVSLIHPDDHSAAGELIAQLAAGEPVARFEDRLLRRDGGVVWVAWTAVPEGDRFYAVGRDVTREREREDALRQAQKMEAVGQLTGGVAHDFNNLLTIIRSSTDLLRRPDLPDERRRRYVNAISDTVDRASKLTGQLLAFARRQALKPEVFDVAERVRAVGEMLRTIVGARVELQTEAQCGSCFAEADASQFDTALVNMAVNARDAMDGEGRLTIRIDVAAELPAIRGHTGAPGPFVAVSMADTGVGIPRDQIEQIFEPFFTTKEVGKGTGLGLSQVYGFAKQSGGDIVVESEVGQGTSFTLYLPAVAAGGGGTSHPADAREPERGLGRRVLVVEDNREVGEFSTQLLQDLGYETTWAASASEALALLSGGQAFDVVFSDVVMPGMSGVELGQEIRSHYPGLPVILTSGYSHVLAEEGRHGFELLQKPYAVEELSRVLRRVSRRRTA